MKQSSQTQGLRMSPLYVTNMMVFKQYLTKEEITQPPIVTKIYGRRNANRDILIKAMRSYPTPPVSKPPPALDHSMDMIDKAFEKERKGRTIDQPKMRLNIHTQLMNSKSIAEVVSEEFTTHLPQQYYNILQTVKTPNRRLNFKRVQTIAKAKAMLSEHRERSPVMEQQLTHDRECFDVCEEEESKLQPFCAKNYFPLLLDSPRNNNESLLKQFERINSECKTERAKCNKILKKCCRQQGKMQSQYAGILYRYNDHMK